MTEIHPGDVIADRYRVSAVLGRGRGLLLDAMHTSFQQRVVVRVISPALADAKAVDRFQLETRILSELETEHVARIIDVGTLPNGALYLVREYLDGVSLSEHARTSQPKLTETVDLFLQICEAVQESHSRGVVLRDLQAEHVFVTNKRSGSPVAKITDFGTCKVMRRDDSDEQSCTKLLGLSSSASPELVRQMNQIDERADVWSLGCMLYEMLTSTPAFAGDGIQLMLAIANDEPVPPSSLRRDIDVPVAIDQTIGQALSKRRGNRFQTVYQLAASLRPYASARGQLLIDDIARLAGEEPTASAVAPYTHTPVFEESRDEGTAAFSRSALVAQGLPAMGAPFPLAPTRSRSSMPAPRASVPAPAPSAAPVAPVIPAMAPVPTPPSTPYASPAAKPSVPAQFGSYASPRRDSSYPAVVADTPVAGLSSSEISANLHMPSAFPVSMSKTGTDWTRKALVGSAIAMTPIAIVLFVYLLASSPDVEVAQAAFVVPTEIDVAAQVAPTVAPAKAPAVETEVAASEAVPEANDDDAEEAEEAASDKPAAASAPRARSARGSSQFLGADGTTSKKRKKDKGKKKRKKGKKGTIVAMAVGASCTFAVDGSARGSSSSVRVKVAPGTHTVSCQPVGGSTRSKTVKVESGKAAVAVFKF